MRRLAETGPNADIDFLHPVGEVEDLGSERLISVLDQTRRLIEDLLRLEHSPAADPRRGWLPTVDDARRAIEDRLTPTIRKELGRELPKPHAKASKDAAKERERRGEAKAAAAALPATPPHPLERPLDEDWYPDNRHGLGNGQRERARRPPSHATIYCRQGNQFMVDNAGGARRPAAPLVGPGKVHRT